MAAALADAAHAGGLSGGYYRKADEALERLAARAERAERALEDADGWAAALWEAAEAVRALTEEIAEDDKDRDPTDIALARVLANPAPGARVLLAARAVAAAVPDSIYHGNRQRCVLCGAGSRISPLLHTPDCPLPAYREALAAPG